MSDRQAKIYTEDDLEAARKAALAQGIEQEQNRIIELLESTIDLVHPDWDLFVMDALAIIEGKE